MKLWDLIKEIFFKYSKQFIAERSKKGVMANLFFIPLMFALVVAIALIVQLVVPPDWL